MSERLLSKISGLPSHVGKPASTAIVELETEDGQSFNAPFSALGGMPDSHASTHQHGGSDEIGVDEPAANAIPKADAAGKLDAWISAADTTRPGVVQLAADDEESASKAVKADDPRLSDARPAASHGSTHAGLSSDPIPTATTTESGLMSPLDKQKLDGLSPGSTDLASVLLAEADDLELPYNETDIFMHSKFGIAYGKGIGELVNFEHRKTPVTWAEAKSTANPGYPEYFPAIPRYDGDHDITTAQAPLLVAELIDKIVTVGSTSTFSGVLASGVITLSASTDNDNLLIALANAALVNRWFGTNQSATYEASGGLFTGDRQYCLEISGTRYAIEDVDAVAREITITSPPADGAVYFTVPQYGIAGSTTSIRLRQLSGFVPVACGDYDGDVIEGFAKMDRVQHHLHNRNTAAANEITLRSGGTVNYSAGAGSASFQGTTGAMVTDGINGAPRSGKTTDPRGYGVAVYTWARTLLARDWT